MSDAVESASVVVRHGLRPCVAFTHHQEVGLGEFAVRALLEDPAPRQVFGQGHAQMGIVKHAEVVRLRRIAGADLPGLDLELSPTQASSLDQDLVCLTRLAVYPVCRWGAPATYATVPVLRRAECCGIRGVVALLPSSFDGMSCSKTRETRLSQRRREARDVMYWNGYARSPRWSTRLRPFDVRPRGRAVVREDCCSSV